MDLKKGDKNEPSSFLDKLGFQKRKVKQPIIASSGFYERDKSLYLCPTEM